ncbi:MAG: recombinase family protein [Allosphingosinicella sp.]|uniref:recombinase family protein n=1 Tax=Allosphingosinicella sp. TaxID=2823234 RepID=UPI003942831F
MKLGYARVSTEDQNLDLQRQALTAAGCDLIFEDRISGATTKRPGLDEALGRCGAGDVLVVWKLDRLGRSLLHLIEVIQQLGNHDCGFQSLSENIDTTTGGGRLVFHLMGALAEFERALIGERTKAGLAAARQRGVRIGRKRAMTAEQVRHARALLEAGERPTDIARSMQVGRSTLYRTLDAEKGHAA